MSKTTIILIIILIGKLSFAQKAPVPKDSTKVYRDIEAYSTKNKYTKFIYRLVFIPTPTKPTKKEAKKKQFIQKPYSKFEGKIIRNIEIVSLKPFGTSATDTSYDLQNRIYKWGNSLHIKSHHITINNLLLFRKNQPFDSLLVKESERLIRSQSYVHEVSFRIRSSGHKSDSVDVIIYELDSWSIIPDGSISNTSMDGSLVDKNFLGTGHEFRNEYSRNFTNDYYTFNTNYFIPNIKNTYINTTLHYGFDRDNYYNKSIIIDRPFFSPFAKWAAGVSFSAQFMKDSSMNLNLKYVPFNSRFYTQDYWLGFAHQIFKGNTEDERTTNLIYTARFLHIDYAERPIEGEDPYNFFVNQNFYLASIGISSRKYIRDKYVFNNGVVEDVPIGRVIGFTGGFQEKENTDRVYLGIRYSTGNYYKLGYLSTNIEYGTFLNSSKTEQGVFAVGINYFTNLLEIGNWKFRQFIKPQFTMGINRFPSERLNINGSNGILGFNSNITYGTEKAVLTLQTQSYAPWNLIGFRFGPFLSCSLGMLGDDENGFNHRRLNTQIGIGILIKNENLVFNTFQISISFYPYIPNAGSDVMKLNAFKTTDFGFRNFEFGKPQTVGFQ